MSIERGFFSGIVKTTAIAASIGLSSPALVASSTEAMTKKTTTTIGKKDVLKKRSTTTKKRPLIVTSTTRFEQPTSTTKQPESTTSTTTPIETAPTSSTLPTKIQLTEADLINTCWVRTKPVFDPNKFVDPENPFYRIDDVIAMKKQPPFFSSLQGCGIIANAITEYNVPAPPGMTLKACGPNEVLGLSSTNVALTYIVASQGALIFPLSKESDAIAIWKKANPDSSYADGVLVNKSRNGYSPVTNVFSRGEDLLRQGTAPEKVGDILCEQKATSVAQAASKPQS